MMDRDTVSHELRTPLTTIRVVLEMLARGPNKPLNPERALDLVKRAIAQTRNLEDVIKLIEVEFSQVQVEDRVIVIIEEHANGLIGAASLGLDRYGESSLAR